MQIFTSITGTPLAEIPPLVQRLETNGFTGITTQENRFNPFLPLAVAAVASTRLELQTSVAIAFARSPMAAANAAWDLQAASDGRFTLGIGSQVKGHNVRRFSVPWSPPAPRMQEYIEALRAIFDCWQHDTPLDYQGEHYQFSLMTPNFMPPRQERGVPRLCMAAVGPATLRAAARVCDGVMLHPFNTRRYIEDVVQPLVGQTLADRGRDPGAFEISGGGFVATGADDEAVAKQFEWVRTRVGFYGSTPAYWPVLEAHGWGDLGRELNRLSKEGAWEAMTAAVPDEVVAPFVAVGRYDQIAEAIAERFGGLTASVSLPADTPANVVAAVAAI